jgi:hypothetical protein
VQRIRPGGLQRPGQSRPAVGNPHPPQGRPPGGPPRQPQGPARGAHQPPHRDQDSGGARR